jgi:hypothetical protein
MGNHDSDDVDAITFDDVTEEVARLLAREIAQERDAVVLYQLYKNVGWHEVRLGWRDRSTTAEISRWCRDSVAGNYYGGGESGWLFELESDAVLFTLRWL